VFITSVSAEMVSPNRGDYCVSKAGLAMAASLFAVRLAEHGIPVYEVRPGIVATDMTAGVKEQIRSTDRGGPDPDARWGTPEDVGGAVAAYCAATSSTQPEACCTSTAGYRFRGSNVIARSSRADRYTASTTSTLSRPSLTSHTGRASVANRRHEIFDDALMCRTSDTTGEDAFSIGSDPGASSDHEPIAFQPQRARRAGDPQPPRRSGMRRGGHVERALDAVDELEQRRRRVFRFNRVMPRRRQSRHARDWTEQVQ
jgi:hypothetical protein